MTYERFFAFCSVDITFDPTHTTTTNVLTYATPVRNTEMYSSLFNHHLKFFTSVT